MCSWSRVYSERASAYRGRSWHRALSRNRRRAAEFLLRHFPGAALAAVVHHPEEAELLGARLLELGFLEG